MIAVIWVMESYPNGRVISVANLLFLMKLSTYCLFRHNRYKSQKLVILPVAEDRSRCDIH